MRQSEAQLVQQEQEAQILKTKRSEFETTITPETAKRISSFVPGGKYTNPELKAALGLSGVPVNPQDVHANAVKKVRENYKFNTDFKTAFDPADAGKGTPGSLNELFVREQKSKDRSGSRVPDPWWYDKVDPTGYWRNLYVPNKAEIKDARDLLNLSEAQLMKWYIGNGGNTGVGSLKLPYWSGTAKGDETVPGFTGTMYDSKTGKPIAGTQDASTLLREKFPNFAKLQDAYYEAQNPPASIMQQLSADLGPSMAMTKDIVALPFRFLGFLAPDQLSAIADVPRGIARGATTAFTGLAQFTKANIEYQITNPGGSIGTFKAPPTGIGSEDFVNTVIRGNVISQIAEAAFKGEDIDLGSGFFPEGKIAEEARIAHDAGLPKIAGKTWTLGRAAVEPLIQENWIDRDGVIASTLSGLTDAVFTAATDPSIYFDPVQKAMKVFNLSRTGATTLLNSRKADIVRDAWAAERLAAKQPTLITDVIDMVFDPTTGRYGPAGGAMMADDIPRFAGMLPPGTALPDDIEKAAQALAAREIEGKSLAALDSPPNDIVYTPPPGSRADFESAVGIVYGPEGIRPDPMAIDNMPFTRDGRKTLEKLGSYNNAGELYDAFIGNIPPGAAIAIQDIVDAARAAGQKVDINDIHKVLVDGVLSADPFYGVAEVPGWMGQAVTQTGKKFAQSVSGKTRQFATMPGSTFFSFDDPMGSIKDMNRLMVVLKVPKTERHAMLDTAMRAVAQQGSGSRFELANKFMETVISPALRKNGVDEAWIKQVSSWSKWSNEIRQWTMDAIGMGYPTPWLEDGTGDIIRSVDFLNQGFLMLSPDAFNKAIRETTNLYRLVKPFRGKSEALEKILDQQVTNKLAEIQGNYLKPVAMGAPLPIRMVTRILPDEMLRVAATGGMGVTSLKILGMGGHVNYTTHGEVIKSAKQITKIFPIVERLEELGKKLDDLVAASKAGEARDVANEIAKIEAKHGTLDELLGYVKTYQERMDTVLPGANRMVAEQVDGLMAKERKDPRVMRYERSTVTQHAWKERNPTEWVEGTATDLVRMNASEEYRAIAKVLLTGSVADSVALPERFLTGDLKPVLDKYRKGLGNESVMIPLTSIDGVTAWVQTIVEDIFVRSGMDTALIEVVANGKLGAAAASTRSATNVYKASPELIDYVKANALTNPRSAAVAPFHFTTAVADMEEMDRWFTKMFSVYRDASAKYARNPFSQSEKWKRIIELMPVMDPAEALKMVEALDKSDAPDWLIDSIKRELPNAKGTATRKQVETLGEMHGQQRMADVLYDYSKKSYFGSKHNLLFGFFDAWFEQWSVWTRQIIEQPTLLQKANLAKTGLEETGLPDAWQKNDGGILFKDEDSDQHFITVPFSQEVYKMLGLDAEERISVKNLTLLGQAIPGFFGFGAMSVDSMLPKSENFQALRSVLFAYGDPEAKSKIADYVVPAFGQGLISGSLGIAKRAGVLPSSDFIDNVQAIMVGDMSERQKAGLKNSVLTNMAYNWNGIPLTVEERDALLSDVEAKTDWLSVLKSTFRIVSPTASMTKFFVETGQESVTSGTVMDDIRKFQEETGDYNQAVTKTLEKYGPSAWIYLSGASTANPGMQATKEFAEWQSKNGHIVDKYPLIGSYFGPQTGEYDPKAFSSQRASGYRAPKDIKARQDKALKNLAWNIYRTKQQRFFAEGAKQGLVEKQVRNSPEFKSEMKKLSASLKKTYPMWSPSASGDQEQVDQLQEIARMVKDKKVLSTTGGKALKEYWDYRNSRVDGMTKAFPEMDNDTWKESPRASGFRQDLIDKAEAIIAKTPEFGSMWENILSREFSPPEVG
jgi:hypothetical protein